MVTHRGTHCCNPQSDPQAGSSSSAVPGNVAGFETVANEEVSYEVSRAFAAMLQLINNR